jgi:hypothetical protein
VRRGDTLAAIVDHFGLDMRQVSTSWAVVVTAVVIVSCSAPVGAVVQLDMLLPFVGAVHILIMPVQLHTI